MMKNNLKINIRKMNLKNDINHMYKLWLRVFKKKWLINKNDFIKILTKDYDDEVAHLNFIAEINNNIVGFIISKYDKNKKRSSITLIMVDNKFQKNGIGKKLVNIVEEYYQNKNIRDIQLGAGVGSYFWSGVPDNLPNAKKFFQKLEWKFSEESFDMVQDISNFKAPLDIFNKIEKEKINLETLSQSDINKLLDFELSNFPEWFFYFKDKIKRNKLNEILIAKHQNGEILGSTLLDLSNFIWKKMFSGSVGRGGALGVKERARGKGIGIALKVRGMEILKEKGAKYIWIGWTHLVDWYAKIGFKVWMKYHMAWKKL